MKTINVIAVVTLSLSVAGCYRSIDDAVKSASSVGANSGVPKSASIEIKVSNSSGTVIYDSASTASSGFKMKAGSVATIAGKISNFKAGDVGSLEVKDVSLPSTPIVLTLSSNAAGDITGSFAPTKAGDFAIQAKVSRSGEVIAKTQYIASVECASPTFTAGSLNSNAISATGSNGIYTFSAASVVAGANGQAPYRCAFDFNGDGVVDSQLADCAQSKSSILSTYVKDRKISVVVADACNTSYAVSKTIMLNASEPAMPGNIFVYSLNSAMTGCAADQRVANVQYRAENANGKNPCNPKYGNGAFTIECLQNYGLPHSKSFGVKVDVSGLGSYDIRANTGSIDATNAKVSRITYTTDEMSDEAPALQFEGMTCTSAVQARVLNVSNKPCAVNPSVTDNSATVEVYGTFTCTNVANACGSMTVSGKFDGYYHLNDNCVGGGQGGGGDPDPNF